MRSNTAPSCGLLEDIGCTVCLSVLCPILSVFCVAHFSSEIPGKRYNFFALFLNSQLVVVIVRGVQACFFSVACFHPGAVHCWLLSPAGNAAADGIGACCCCAGGGVGLPGFFPCGCCCCFGAPHKCWYRSFWSIYSPKTSELSLNQFIFIVFSSFHSS